MQNLTKISKARNVGQSDSSDSELYRTIQGACSVQISLNNTNCFREMELNAKLIRYKWTYLQ